jgi:hypothetical protein
MKTPAFVRPMAMSLLAVLLSASFAGCDQVQSKLGIEDPAAKLAKLEAEGKAIGSACRQSGRAIEDCYSVYTWVPKASVFGGWREMDAYMRENRLEIVEPVLPPAPPPPEPVKKTKKKKAADGEGGDKAADEKAGDAKAEEKPAADKAASH